MVCPDHTAEMIEILVGGEDRIEVAGGDTVVLNKRRIFSSRPPMAEAKEVMASVVRTSARLRVDSDGFGI
jgi:hypothetical protein